MKKIIAIAMALVMMMAIAVPAFAATLEGGATADTQSGDSTVMTDTSGVVGDGEYTVTYPATLPLTWGTESTPFEYSVTSQLKAGKNVTVVLADKADGLIMKNADGDELPYALNGTTTGVTSAEVVTDETFNFTVDVATADWDAVAFDTYEDIVTFTSNVTTL